MDEFDVIVVGAGSAGCVVAARLSEDPATRVLVLEAGGPARKKEIRIPAAFPQLFESEVDWNYRTEPQSGLDDRTIYTPRGKVLGGSSSSRTAARRASPTAMRAGLPGPRARAARSCSPPAR